MNAKSKVNGKDTSGEPVAKNDSEKRAASQDTPTKADVSNEGSASEKPSETVEYKPSFRLLAEYLKDLSFENPSLVRIFTGESEAIKDPKIDIQVNIRSRRLVQDKNLYETELSIEANAKKDDKALFTIEAVYAAIVEAVNVPDNNRDALLLIEVPRFLFPFMRETIARETQRGGLQPLLLEPIDFAELFRRRQEQQNNQKTN